MKTQISIIALLAVLSVSLTGSIRAADAPPSDDGWVDLFDGKTLDGWTQRNGTATYRVEDGAIVGTTAEGSPNSFLCTNKDYGNFELVFDVKVDNALNSGVQIRSKTAGGPTGRVNGPQVEIEASKPNGSLSGYVYGEAAGGWMTPDALRKPHAHFKNDQWNNYRVVANGPTIGTWINGRHVGDVTHDERFKTHAKGFIGLQVHGIPGGAGPHEVSWKNIRIRPILPADDKGFVTLYNGKDLTGWKTTGNWIPQKDGSVQLQPRAGEGGWQRYSSYLWAEGTYKDFVLDVEYAYPPMGNSGVYFRVKDMNNPVETGIEAQVLDSSSNPRPLGHHDHGGILFTSGPTQNMSKVPGQWNRMIVTCRGYHLQVVLNGVKIQDLQLDKSAIRDRPLEGYIGFQDHGHPNTLRFRNIRIKRLAAEE